MMQQMGPGPHPAPVVLRVIAADSSSRVASLVLADADSLVLYDLKAKTRFVMREEPGVRLELYRGQGETGKAAPREPVRERCWGPDSARWRAASWG